MDEILRFAVVFFFGWAVLASLIPALSTRLNTVAAGLLCWAIIALF